MGVAANAAGDTSWVATPARARQTSSNAGNRTVSITLGITGGLRAFLGGIGFVLSTPGVWPYAVIPALVMLVLSIGLSVLGIYAAGWMTDGIFDEEKLGTWSKIGYWTVKVLFWLLGIVLAVVFGLALAQPLSGFALDAIARRQEEALTGFRRPDPPFIAGMLRGVRVAAVTVVVGGILFGGLFVVDMVFPPALAVTIPLKFLIAGWLIAWDFLDYPLGLRGLGIRARLDWFGRQFGAVTAFGAAWSLLIIVPGIVLILLPMGVAGATRMVVEADPSSPRR
jgi:CysZ protein